MRIGACQTPEVIGDVGRAIGIVRAFDLGERGSTHIGLGPTGFIDPAGEVVALVPPGVTGMVTLDIATGRARLAAVDVEPPS